MNVVADHADDLLHDVYRRLLRARSDIATRGSFREVISVRLELRNPRCRLSQTESRGKIFSALGELIWYLSGENSLDFIEYYIPFYKGESEDGKTVIGGYGPRLFLGAECSQWNVVRRLLLTKKTTRRAVINILSPDDVLRDGKEIPCTVAIQFFVRDDKLHMQTFMRSNDAVKGLPHDIFAFTMLQEIMARDIGVDIGRYYHSVGSLHLYEHEAHVARDYLEQGFQEAQPMPAMPFGSQWSEIRKIINFSESIRVNGNGAVVDNPVTEYWGDIALLLRSYRARKDKDNKAVHRYKNRLIHQVYKPYIRVRGNETVARPALGEQLSLLEGSDVREE